MNPVVNNVLARARAWIIARIKIPLWRFGFRWFGSRFRYPLLKGRMLVRFRELFAGQVRFPQSVCNAGLCANERGGFTAIFKSQTYTVEPGAYETHGLPDRRDLKQLYVADFDPAWRVEQISELSVRLDGKTVSPEEGLEDVRLFTFDKNIRISANYGGHTRDAWPCLGIYGDRQARLSRPGYTAPHPQKNWMPFVCDGRIYLEFMVSPRTILEYNPSTGTVNSCNWPVQHWYSGTIHGGAPAVRIAEDCFLGLANVQDRFWYQERYYSSMFYLFEARPPFHVKQATPPLRFRSRRNRVQYAAGLVFDPVTGHLIVSYGVNDYDNWIESVPVERVWSLLSAV